MEKDLVSIVIPVYNAERFLNDTIETILNQVYQNWEAIFVDDCSNDSSVDIIKKYAKKDERIKLCKMEQNQGNPSFPRNIGIEKAKGRYLCFLDADDKWDSNKIAKQVDFMKNNDCAFSYTSYEFADEMGIPMGKKVIAHNRLNYKQALKNTIISTITVMFDLNKVSKSLIKMPNLKYVEDTATWWRILRSGFDAYGIADVFSYYRRIPNSNSSNKLKTQKYLWNLYRNEENLNIFKTIYYLSWKNLNAVLRRI